MSRPGNRDVSRREKEMQAGIFGFGKFLLVVGVLLYVGKLVYELMVQPELHPQIMLFLWEMLHHHPTLTKISFIVPIMLIIAWRILNSPTVVAARTGAKRLQNVVAIKSDSHLELPTTLSFNVEAAATWRYLNKVFPGLSIEVDGIRVTHWRAVESDISKLQLKLSLTYDRISSGQSSGRPDPRVLNCVATVKGRGISSNVLLSFSADNMLDNRYTPNLIAATTSGLQRALELEAMMDAPLDLEQNLRSRSAGQNRVQQYEQEIANADIQVDERERPVTDASVSSSASTQGYTNFDGSSLQ
ncbi:MAG: hypothetical protein KGS72_22830 [Cyanobacteria bacterium REEB67]|nr:hypothetical protein [Cyanobacteria bacterium REEB67]